MSATFVTLPTEVLDSILESMTMDEVVNLWKTNNQLSHRIEEYLFGHPAALNYTMKWACKTGYSHLLRRAVSCGASPSYIFIKPGEKSSKYVPKRTAEWSHESQIKTSTLLMVAGRHHEEALDVLLALGAKLENITVRERQSLSKDILTAKRWEMLRKFINAGLGSYVFDPLSINHSLMAFIKHGTPIELLRLMIKGQDLNVVLRDGRNYVSCPLSGAIDQGSQAVVELLIEEGASIHGFVECYDASDIRDRKGKPIRYFRPKHIPIFAAAYHMARTGSTDMMDLCLHYGADINQRAPAMPQHWDLAHHFPSSPLMAYLEGIESFQATDGLKPIAGIQYFMRHGAEIQPATSQRPREWEWLGSGRWANFNENELCQPLSIVEVLLGKWYLESLHERQFVETIRWLIDQGSGVSRAESIIQNFCFDSEVTSFPLPQTHQDHPDNVPMWWELVRQLWNKIDDVYGDSYAWMKHSLRPRSETRGLLDAGIKSQEDKNTLLYTSVTEENYLFWPHFYGTLDRLVIDRQQDLGADINAFSGENGQTLLYEVCDQINKAYVKDEADDISWDFKDPKKSELFRVKFKEFCLSLVDKGADPGLHVGGLTAADVLSRDAKEASVESQAYLADLALEMQKARTGFLKNGPTPSTLVKRADLFSLVPPSDSWSLSGYRPSGRTEWLE